MFDSKKKSDANLEKPAEVAAEALENLGMILDKLAILGVDDSQVELVEMPEWGGSVYVKALKSADKDAFDNIISREGTDEAASNFRARFAALCVCDEHGTRLFEDEDAEALGKKSASALSRVFDAASKLNGMMDKNLDDAEKNSEANPN